MNAAGCVFGLHVAVKVTVCPDTAGLGAAVSEQSGGGSVAAFSVIRTGRPQVCVDALQPSNVYVALPVCGATTWIADVWRLPGVQLKLLAPAHPAARRVPAWPG